jgi:hypothetical protein
VGREAQRKQKRDGTRGDRGDNKQNKSAGRKLEKKTEVEKKHSQIDAIGPMNAKETKQ